MEKLKERSSKGITLIALVITIIVLIILAGITIAMLTGENGILQKANSAKNATNDAKLDEAVRLAVTEAVAKGLGTVEENNLREALNNNLGEGKYNLSGDETEGWDIVIKANGNKYHVDKNGTITKEEGETGNKEYNPNYSEPVTEDDIAPIDVFLYETDDTTNTAKITGMNPRYCNGEYDEYMAKRYESLKTSNRKQQESLNKKITIDGQVQKMSNVSLMNINDNNGIKLSSESGSTTEPDPEPDSGSATEPDTGSNSTTGGNTDSSGENTDNSGSTSDEEEEKIIDTNYDIIYKGTKISDTLIVPDKLIKDGKEYIITEANIAVISYDPIGPHYGMPNVKTIIFPNTITKIESKWHSQDNSTIEKIVLPSGLKVIGTSTFENCTKLIDINWPTTLKEIGDSAFYKTGIKNVEISNVEKIDGYAFAYCGSLESIDWPETLTTIEAGTFYCSGIKNIKIPNVETIGNRAFAYCFNLQNLTITSNTKNVGYYALAIGSKGAVNVFFKENEKPKDWDYRWYYCADDEYRKESSIPTINYQQ